MPTTSQSGLSRWDTNSLLSGGLLVLLVVAYAALIYAAILAVAMAAGSMVGSQYIQDLTPPWWLNLIALAAIAATILPVTRWLRSRVNDLVYAQHDDPYALMTRINAQLQEMTNPALTLPTLAETVGRELRLQYVAIEAAHVEPPACYTFGAAPSRNPVSRLPIAYLGQPMGTLMAAARSPGQPLSDSDLALLRDVAQQLGVALRAAQLTADLQATRERLVIAREEERRRIRNDLHDELAATLSALQMQLGAMRSLIRRDPDQAEAIARELREDLRQATAEIRRLVYDLRPPMLDDLGLVGAIRNFKLQDSDMDLQVAAPEPMPRLSAAVEVAVYRIASEAMQNVVKHAQATQCNVCIAVNDGYLTLGVTDNGKGSPADAAAGVGMQSMRERAAELGGTLSVQANETGGTSVIARLPMGVTHG
ncbi:MAG: GAF domain-containing sensor histidine kinase [Anaerolineae bacterium]